jgi:hypothetical protein
MMAATVEQIPSGLLTLKLPPGYSLDRWVEQETERLKEQHPHIQSESVELGPKYRRMHEVASHRRKAAETQYELLKLRMRERLGDAAYGTALGVPFISRRIYPVPGEPSKRTCAACGTVTSEHGYWVDGYEMDAMFPV